VPGSAGKRRASDSRPAQAELEDEASQNLSTSAVAFEKSVVHSVVVFLETSREAAVFRVGDV
jgi:hypothetical protein